MRAQPARALFAPCPVLRAQPLSTSDLAASVAPASEEESADGVPGCGYLVTGDDFSTLRLFNYPVVWDDAPYKVGSLGMIDAWLPTLEVQLDPIQCWKACNCGYTEHTTQERMIWRKSFITSNFSWELLFPCAGVPGPLQPCHVRAVQL